MGPILENVRYLRHSYLIQRNYLTNKHSYFKEMSSWNTQNNNWKLKMHKKPGFWYKEGILTNPGPIPGKLMQHTPIPWNVKLF